MLDDLLGKTALRERIEELEGEKHRLKEQLEAEQERRAEAVTDRQEAQHRVNRLEDRIEQLEDRVERLRSEETTVSVRREERLTDRHLDTVLSRLESVETGPQGALTAFVPDGRDLDPALRGAFGDRSVLVARSAPCLAVTDDTGLIAAGLRPPCSPDPFTVWDEGFRIDREWFQPEGRYTLALVRSDLFAMGTYRGDERTAFHGFDSQLKGQHSKGGFSQARFERLRDEQIDDHLERCRAAIGERETETLYVVGERSLLGEFMHMADETATADATGDPEEALASAFQDFWSVKLRVF